jgi:diaminopimelate epimerase
LAAEIVGFAEEGLMDRGRRFYKMSGSGNDFVFFDEADGPSDAYREPAAIETLCTRGTGVGADGVVFFDRSDPAAVGITYFNSDGSAGELCGNATLCTVRLAEILGTPVDGDLLIRTDAGEVSGRLVDGVPEIDLEPVRHVSTDWSEIPLVAPERRIGYALVGVPHIAIAVPDIAAVDVLGRGSQVRRHKSLAHGANANFLAPAAAGRWAIRTYERGVEAETLACGTGAVASAILLVSWGQAHEPVRLVTKSGRELTVTLRRKSGLWYSSLRGSAELVFTGELPT